MLTAIAIMTAVGFAKLVIGAIDARRSLGRVRPASRRFTRWVKGRV